MNFKTPLLSLFACSTLVACGSGSFESAPIGGGAPDAEAVEEEVADAAPPAADADLGIPAGRVVSGIQVLYTFTGSPGDTVVRDLSQVGEPYDLTIQDPAAVQWVDDGLLFSQPGLVTSALPATKINEACSQANAITIEAWVQSSALTPDNDTRVIALSIDTANRNFGLGQPQGNDYWRVRLRTSETNDNGSNPSYEAPSGTVTGEMQHVVYTREGLGGLASLYVDGVKQAPETIPGSMINWNLEYSLNVGNEATQDRPFLGQINLAAVYCRTLSATEVRQNYDAGY